MIIYSGSNIHLKRLIENYNTSYDKLIVLNEKLLTFQNKVMQILNCLKDLIIYAENNDNQWLSENREHILAECNQFFLQIKEHDFDLETSTKIEEVKQYIFNALSTRESNQMIVVREPITPHATGIVSTYSLPSITKTSLFSRTQELSELEIKQQNDAEYFELLQSIKEHDKASLAILSKKGESAIPLLQEEIESNAQYYDHESVQVLGEAIGYWQRTSADAHAKEADEGLMESGLTSEEKELLAIFGNR
ncbi:MAG: hypothetical protein KBD03_03640 [Gammaproteobacteria bacterium]|nr:hypothetical protein [Gammaproteobacteria bacterium]